MNYLNYIKDKLLELIVFILTFIMMLIIFVVFNSHTLLILAFIFCYVLLFFIIFIYDYLRRVKFYNYFRNKLDTLDKKYLITEIINNDNFLEASILKEYLYEIDKSYTEELNKYKYSIEEFKEYIELWCHEIKTPVSTTKLIIDNNKNEITKSISEEIDTIEYFIEQVLFYSRSDTVEKDYIVSNVNIKEIIDEVFIKNKKDLINKSIKVKSLNKDIIVNSDPKWLLYILNQIVINSIKYSKDKNAIIEVEAKENKNNTILTISDNGIGIKADEIDRVFEKSFTGSNGRSKFNSTGMGLYLCKKLCDKLDSDILISSVNNKYTKVSIVFPINSMTK